MTRTLEKISDIKFIAVVIILLNTFCATAQLYPHEGYLDVKGGKVWYRIVGSGNKTPLLLLHGGPGATSYYLNPLNELAKDRPVIFFDQLGCGRSSRITDTSLMNLDNYVEEVAQLKEALGINEYYLYGHSWGTMLGMDYYLKHPEGIKAIIFSSPLFSTDLWITDAQLLIKTLPDSVQHTIGLNEQHQTYSSPDYQRAVQIYYHHFLIRTEKYPADLDSTSKSFGENVYAYMWGPSEFKATGTLKNYNRLQELAKIMVPVLLTCGEYDEARPATVKYYQSLLPGSKLIVIKNSGHNTMIDNTEDNNEAIGGFLKKMDK
ncbi:MAG: pip [Chitinophagaceae bacterium]|nr:pip [Chitinophagaceae bacterium]